MSKKLTPWFPPHVKPVHCGIYNASYQRDESVFFFWNGKHWAYLKKSPLAGRPCVVQEREWRGLAKKP